MKTFYTYVGYEKKKAKLQRFRVTLKKLRNENGKMNITFGDCFFLQKGTNQIGKAHLVFTYYYYDDRSSGQRTRTAHYRTDAQKRSRVPIASSDSGVLFFFFFIYLNRVKFSRLWPIPTT